MCLDLDNIMIDDSGRTKGGGGDYKLRGVGEEMEFSLLFFKLWKTLCLKITGCSV